MKAFEVKNLLGGLSLNFNADKKIKVHKERLAKIKGVIDTSTPYGFSPRREERHSSPRRAQQQIDENDRVSKDNFHLAQRIYKIMESPGMITDLINDTRHLDAHPGTMNYKARLEEAQKIHNRNMAMAARLDSIKPFYGKSDLTLQIPLRRKNDKKNKKSHQKNHKIEYHIQNALLEIHGPGNITHRSEGNGYSNQQQSDMYQSYSARRAEPDEAVRNVILEHTKVQDGRVLELAVIKEPYQDQYSIYGIDVDNGQKYELKLTSEDVASILDGDILVTSVDNVMVWLMLLNKCKLYPVDSFSRNQKRKNDLYQDDEYQEFDDPFEDAEDPSNLEDKTLGEMDESFFFPAAPKATRPSTSGGRAGRRRGGGGTAGSKKERTGYTAEQGLFGLGETSGSDLKSNNQSPSRDDFADNYLDDDVDENSVIKIQSKIRSSLAKKKVDLLKKEKEEQEVAAIRLQSKIRTSFAKKKVDKLKNEKYSADRARSANKREKDILEKKMKEEKEEQEAAILLQSITRRKLANKKIESLKKEKGNEADSKKEIPIELTGSIEEQQAAILLQSIARKRATMKKVEALKNKKVIVSSPAPSANTSSTSNKNGNKQILKPAPPTTSRAQINPKNSLKPSVRPTPNRNNQERNISNKVKGSAPAPVQEKPKLPAPEKYLRPNLSKKTETTASKKATPTASKKVASSKPQPPKITEKKEPKQEVSKFKLLDVVECNHKNNGTWFKGKISLVGDDNVTYDIKYDDGDEENNVSEDRIRIQVVKDEVNINLKEGDVVECNYKGQGKWYSGTIASVRDNGTYHIQYDDGDSGINVDASLIRLKEVVEIVADEGVVNTNISLKEGDKCEANYKGNGKWYPGKIISARDNGTFDIQYDDGESETNVKGTFIRLKEVVEIVADEVVDNTNISLKEGDKCEANYKGNGKWYPGKIISARDNGTFDIQYDDGESETNVKGTFIRLVELVIDEVDESATPKEAEIVDNNNEVIQDTNPDDTII